MPGPGWRHLKQIPCLHTAYPAEAPTLPKPPTLPEPYPAEAAYPAEPPTLPKPPTCRAAYPAENFASTLQNLRKLPGRKSPYPAEDYLTYPAEAFAYPAGP